MTNNSVLIIDDNEIDIMVHRRQIERSGRFGRVMSASDGRIALDMYTDYQERRMEFHDDFPPLVVLLDINMPRLDGFEFLDHFRNFASEFSEQYIVMLTSSDSPTDRARADDDPLVVDYLVKPLTAAQVGELADRFIDD